MSLSRGFRFFFFFHKTKFLPHPDLNPIENVSCENVKRRYFHDLMVLDPLICLSSHPLYYIIETVIYKAKVLTPNPFFSV